MARPNKKDGVTKSVYLGRDILTKAENITNRKNISLSELIEISIANYIDNIDYEKEIFKKQQEIQKIDEEKNKLLKEEQKIRELWIKNLSWKEQLNKKKQDAIRIIMGKITKNQIAEAEQIARTWGRIIHINYEELLAEATTLLSSGI